MLPYLKMTDSTVLCVIHAMYCCKVSDQSSCLVPSCVIGLPTPPQVYSAQVVSCWSKRMDNYVPHRVKAPGITSVLHQWLISVLDTPPCVTPALTRQSLPDRCPDQNTLHGGNPPGQFWTPAKVNWLNLWSIYPKHFLSFTRPHTSVAKSYSARYRTVLGSNWSSVSCSRTLWHVDRIETPTMWLINDLLCLPIHSW